MIIKKIKPLRQILTAVLFTIGLAVLSSPIPIYADTSNIDSKEQIQQDKADEVRRRAKANARASIRYENVDTQTRQYRDELDFLGYQINRLGQLIRQISKELDNQEIKSGEVIPIAPPLISDPKTDSMVYSQSSDPINTLSIYGPEGPTTKSVRLLMEYRLLLGGNPRLKLGKIQENETVIEAQILTIDNSLVQTYIIDKKSGLWKAKFN
jgi:hypothetical protein